MFVCKSAPSLLLQHSAKVCPFQWPSESFSEGNFEVMLAGYPNKAFMMKNEKKVNLITTHYEVLFRVNLVFKLSSC